MEISVNACHLLSPPELRAVAEVAEESKRGRGQNWEKTTVFIFHIHGWK